MEREDRDNLWRVAKLMNLAAGELVKCADGLLQILEKYGATTEAQFEEVRPPVLSETDGLSDRS